MLTYKAGGLLQMGMKIGENPKIAEILSKVQKVDRAYSPATDTVNMSLEETYSKRYTKPSTDMAAIEELSNIFNNLMGYINDDIKDGIGEYYRLLANKQLPAFEWMLEAFHVASKKEEHKRNFPYVVGMIRCWLKYGFGHIPSQEEEELVEYFEEVTGTAITTQARLLIHNLMATYGVIKVTRAIGSLEKEHDISYLMAQILKYELEEKYPHLKGRALDVC